MPPSSMADERIGVLGSGDVGRALGRGFARHGWDVKLGTHSPERLQDWLGEVEGAGGAVSVGSFAEAAAHGDMAVLAVLGEVADVLDLAGPENFAGTLVLDATNPLDFSGGAPPGLLFCGTDSLGERIQASLPDASVVKCFNTVSTAQMVDPSFEEGAPPMMIWGNAAEGKGRTGAILVELDWPGGLDVGGIDSSRYLEALVPLWAIVGAKRDTWRHAFAVIE
ncbi:NADPH-dependent F420 reductase [Halalkalicoccus sp. GCM10025322]|uniref:NADPH-dependent F420 reductase n=3 Tax=Halalkalicoccus TaxID=332246 RepID=UPI00362305B4